MKLELEHERLAHEATQTQLAQLHERQLAYEQDERNKALPAFSQPVSP